MPCGRPTLYVPPAFAEEDLETLHGLIERHPFATLVSVVEGLPFGTHLPMLLDREASARGTLEGHFARANPHWRALDGETPALAIFHGPHAYVSPSGYASAPAVPTWNYVAVHVIGKPHVVTDPSALSAMVDRAVETFERGQREPWRARLPDDYRAKMLKGIVGFRLEIERLEGKLKLSQNKSPADREGVLRALEASGHPDDAALAAFTRERLG